MEAAEREGRLYPTKSVPSLVLQGGGLSPARLACHRNAVWGPGQDMVWYVRFVKVPTIRPATEKGQLVLEFCVDVRNDLREQLYRGSTELVAALSDERGDCVWHRSVLQWDGSLAGEVQARATCRLPHSLCRHPAVRGRLLVGPQDSASNALRVDGTTGLVQIMPARSESFELAAGRKAAPLVYRQLPAGCGLWEDTGHSLAAHVWDAGVVLAAHLAYLSTHSSDTSSPLAELVHRARGSRGRLEVLELGSGCGTSSIALGRCVPACSITATDQDEGMELLRRNVLDAQAAGARVDPGSTPASTSPSTSSTSSTVFREPLALHWDRPEERPAASTGPGGRPWDLILVADCTYNSDMIPHLVSTLRAAAAGSPAALVVIALKRRHESEAVFFDEMDDAGLGDVHRGVFGLPDPSRLAVGLAEEEVEIHQFRRRPVTSQ